MSKRWTIALITLLTIGAISSAHPHTNPSVTNSTATPPTTKTQLICDGTTVTSNCTLDGVKYKTYIYHPAVAEVSHQEQVVSSYKQEVVGYCTLCVDGTYSPSCATGRGACSWHGGVSEWNAPEYSSVPVYATKTVIDTPAKAAYYDKVLD